LKLLKDRGIGKHHIYFSAQEALVTMGSPAVESVIALLGSEKPGIQSAAIQILKEIGDQRAIGPLITVLRDEMLDPSTSSPPILTERAIVKLGGEAQVVDLLTGLYEHEDRHVRDLAKRAMNVVLAEIENPRAIDPLLALLREHIEDPTSVPASNVGIARAIVKLGGAAKASDLMTDLRAHEDKDVRDRVIAVLNLLNDQP
jgi:HEAT repeat protein